MTLEALEPRHSPFHQRSISLRSTRHCDAAFVGPEDVRVALGVFEFAQNAAQIWRGSKMDQKREILEAVSLNRTLGDVTLVVEKKRVHPGLAWVQV
jgi:hypothetical protein